MTPHRVFNVEESSQVGEARRAAAMLADSLGFDEAAAGRLAIVVTELGTNLVRHATGGRLLLAAIDEGRPSCAVEVLSLDRGPGMADVAVCLEDGYSTAGTPGTGLGAARRQADVFDVFSAPGAGTAIALRVGRVRPPARASASAYRMAAIAVAAPGETVCGDGWGFAEDGPVAGLVVADGLGHGPHAAEASAMAVAQFEATPFAAPATWLQEAHAPMRSTRGAAVSSARFDADAQTITFCGVGNISTRVITGAQDRTLLSQHGTLGLQIRRLQDMVYPWPDHALVVMHSDGIVTRWNLDAVPGLLQCSPAVIAGWLIRDHLRGRDDATVVVLQRA